MAILKIVIIYIAIHLLISRDRLFWERSFVTFVLLPYFFVHASDHLFCLSEKDSMVNLYFDSVYILTAILCWDSGCAYLCLFVTLCIILKKFNSYCSNNNCVSNTSTLSSITCNWITVKIAEWWWVLNYMWCEIQTVIIERGFGTDDSLLLSLLCEWQPIRFVGLISCRTVYLKQDMWGKFGLNSHFLNFKWLQLTLKFKYGMPKSC